MDLDNSVTSVIQQRPKPASVAQYEAWLKEIVPSAQRYPGHRGVNIIRPHGASDAYTIVLHFDTVEHLKGWLDSDTRAQLVERVRPHLATAEQIEIQTGLEYWFTPPAGRPHAKPYKQFLVTLSAIFPLTMVVPWALQPLFDLWPVLQTPGLRHLVIASVIVGLMSYVIMPRYIRAVAGWLYRSAERPERSLVGLGGAARRRRAYSAAATASRLVLVPPGARHTGQ